MPLEEGANQLIVDLVESEKLEKLIFAVLSRDPNSANNLMDTGSINNKHISILTASLLRCGLNEFQQKYPAGDEKAIPLVQKFIQTQIRDVQLKEKEFLTYTPTDIQRIIWQAIKCFYFNIFPEDTESMKKMKSARADRLKHILEKLRNQKMPILKGPPPPDIISKFELTRRILEIIGLKSPYKQIDDMGWVRRIELIAANLVSNTNTSQLSKEYSVNAVQIPIIRKLLADKIKEIIPELKNALDDLCQRKKSPKWSGNNRGAARQAEDEERRRRHRKEENREIRYTETLPVKPLNLNAEQILEFFCHGTAIENITSEMVEASFFKSIFNLKLILPFKDDQIKSFIKTIVTALMNPDVNVDFSEDLLLFLIKISRSGEEGIDKIAATIKKLLGSGVR